MHMENFGSKRLQGPDFFSGIQTRRELPWLWLSWLRQRQVGGTSALIKARFTGEGFTTISSGKWKIQTRLEIVQFFLGNEGNDPFPKSISEKIQTIVASLPPHSSIRYNIFFTVFFFLNPYSLLSVDVKCLPFLRPPKEFPYKLQVWCT